MTLPHRKVTRAELDAMGRNYRSGNIVSTRPSLVIGSQRVADLERVEARPSGMPDPGDELRLKDVPEAGIRAHLLLTTHEDQRPKRRRK